MAGLPDGDGAGEADAGDEGMALAGTEGIALGGTDGPLVAMLGLTATKAVPPGDADAPQDPTRNAVAAAATMTGALRRTGRGPLRMNGS